MGHKTSKQKQKRRQIQKDPEHKAYHTPVLADPQLYICKSKNLKYCGGCPHAEPHLVSPGAGIHTCGGHCEHRDIDTYCVRVKKEKQKDMCECCRRRPPNILVTFVGKNPTQAKMCSECFDTEMEHYKKMGKPGQISIRQIS